jgi:hypothetical protein
MSSIFFPQRIQGDSYFRLERLSIRFGAEWNAWFAALSPPAGGEYSLYALS